MKTSDCAWCREPEVRLQAAGHRGQSETRKVQDGPQWLHWYLTLTVTDLWNVFGFNTTKNHDTVRSVQSLLMWHPGSWRNLSMQVQLNASVGTDWLITLLRPLLVSPSPCVPCLNLQCVTLLSLCTFNRTFLDQRLSSTMFRWYSAVEASSAEYALRKHHHHARLFVLPDMLNGLLASCCMTVWHHRWYFARELCFSHVT